MSFFGAKNRLAHHDHNDLKIDRINITLKLLVNNLELTFLHTKWSVPSRVSEFWNPSLICVSGVYFWYVASR